jgi:hypothetical protein
VPIDALTMLSASAGRADANPSYPIENGWLRASPVHRGLLTARGIDFDQRGNGRANTVDQITSRTNMFSAEVRGRVGSYEPVDFQVVRWTPRLRLSTIPSLMILSQPIVD